MRITNNMMLRNSSININGNKVNVNDLNNQMSSQKKIQRPSENPVIAIRALRLRSTLSEINQYYENNIPDAEAWLNTTETALKNMESILNTIRTQCVYGTNDPLETADRKAILDQLTKLRDQVYAEGNSDYAGRTIFTGYRTNHKLTFMEDEADTRYRVKQRLSYQDIEEYRYYSDDVTVPETMNDVLNGAIPDPQQHTYQRIRLSYEGIESLRDVNAAPGQDPDVSANGGVVSIPYTYTDSDGYPQNDRSLSVTIYNTMADWETAGNAITDDQAVFIKETGELILGDTAAENLRSGKAQFTVEYTKQGFDKGELRPEYYYNCTDITDPDNTIDYIKYDDEGNEIYQDINYIVAANQTITVNTSASSVFDASISRDVDEMIETIRRAQNASDKVARLEEMMKMEEYSSDDAQARLEDWLAAAKKEADYADDNVQKLYNAYIGNFDEYLSKVNLALTDVGSKGDGLAVTKNRMSNQQDTVESLKSDNEDRDISDIIIDYTAAYNAYQASLQAAAKINQNTLLNYV